MKKKKRKFLKRQMLVLILLIIGIIFIIDNSRKQNNEEINDIAKETSSRIQIEENKQIEEDWRIRIVNKENILPEDFSIELDNLDKIRQFDARAISYLKEMIKDMKNQGIPNIWAQSTYRSVEQQKELYNKRVNLYLKQGKTQSEAEELTQLKINKPGASDHNLGLAVDFNMVDNNFEQTAAFKWLEKNGMEYGFILRYPKDKTDITYVSYEPWHWRYVGEEHAKKMKQLNMCLEEYVQYIKNN